MADIIIDTLWKLKGCVRHYPWGGKTFIPEMICLANDEGKPFAELWFGQHPACPSITSRGSTLSDLMASAPEVILTQKERQLWNNELPFLCKILDVQDMLSIQIHPDKENALAGYQEEQQKKIDPAAFERTFKDKNHKPEIMYALSDFYLLHDFRKDQEILEILEEKPLLSEVVKQIRELGVAEFYKSLMQYSQKQINKLLQPFVDRMKKDEVPDDPLNPDYWVCRAIDKYCTPRKVDRGILSCYLLNLVYLKPGEVIFQDSGILHAYLQGQNIEVMANSDNVIRGGLTFKHIDVAALSRLVRFDERKVHYIHPDKLDESQIVFKPPVKEFQLSVIDLDAYQEYRITTKHVSMLFSTCNCFMTRSEYQEIRVGGGEAILVRAGESITIRSRMAAKVFMVTTQAGR